MNNNHHHSNPRFRNPRQQDHNHTSHHADRRHQNPNFSDPYSRRSEQHSPFPPTDQDLPFNHPSYHHRRGNSRSRRDSSGYGGARSSDIPERGTPVIGRDLQSHSRHNRNIRPPHPPYRPDGYGNEPRDYDPSPSKPSHSSNNYKGGCPFTYGPSRTPERNPTNRNVHSRPQTPLPDREDVQEASSLWNKGTTSTSGPVKSRYSSRSPVKPINSRSTADSPIMAVVAKEAKPNHLQSTERHPTATNSKPGNLYNGVISAFRLESKPILPDRTRYNRSLSCEKNFRAEDKLSLHSLGLRGGSAALGYSAIARPTRIPSAEFQPFPQNQTEQQNGSYSQSKVESAEASEKTEQNVVGDAGKTNHRNQKRDSAEKIFKKSSGKPSMRLPKLPDASMSASPTPEQCQKTSFSAAQLEHNLKEVIASSDEGKSRMKLPLLRSVPAPVRSSTMNDTPQKRAAAAALLRAGQVDCEEVKLVKKCQSSRRKPSHEEAAPSDSEPQKAADDSEKEGVPARQVFETSVSEQESVDLHRDPSSTKRGRKLGVSNLENKQIGHLNQPTRNSVGEGAKQDSKSTKRRGTELGESDRVTAKRPRQGTPTEAVNIENTSILRRSQRFQPPKTSKTWELTRCEADRVQNLFQAQLQAQPMLLRISFLGISDGDLRSTLDTYKRGRNLPEPDYRSLEVNNNRIRCITNEICTSISALRVSSLNLSCNMLTTIGGKLGLCSKLTFLNLSRNQLSCLPQELCDLTNLEVLNLSGNNIARLPSGLCRLKKLEILSLARNKLEVLPEDVATEGAALTGLDLSHNHGFHFFPRCTEHWTKLLVLHMPDTEMYRSLSRREHRLPPSALLNELAGRNQLMRAGRRPALRSQSALIRR